MRNRSVLVMLVFSILLGLSPLAADTVIRRGIDSFITPANGRTYYDFAQRPIPAGFFCKGSKPFKGRVTFKGLPLTTQTPGDLQGADTIVERLDDAVLDAQGFAKTRLQFRALSLVSIAPIKTACGAFHAYLSLDGQQRVTTMRINRTEEGGGIFSAPLAVNVRVTFIPVKPLKTKNARKLELTASVTFPASPIPWSLGDATKIRSIASTVVDTNGDLVPDTRLPLASNFLAGAPPDRVIASEMCSCCPGEYCHADDGEMHCTEVTMCPNTYSCC